MHAKSLSVALAAVAELVTMATRAVNEKLEVYSDYKDILLGHDDPIIELFLVYLSVIMQALVLLGLK